MLVEHGRMYVAAFQKPWWVSQFMLQGWARGLGIKIAGLWPRGHANAPRIEAPNAQPYTHLVAGRMAGPSQEIELPKEVAWVSELEIAEAPTRHFVVRRRAG